MKYFYLTFFLVVNLVIQAQDQNFIPTYNYNHTTISDELLSAPNHLSGQTTGLNERLESIVDQFVNNKNILGLSVAMDFPENDNWSYALGLAEENKPLTVDHLMPVGSISKTITTTTLLKLYDEALLDLDDTIGTWITHDNIDPAITIRQCLNHTSGIYNYTDNSSFNNSIFADMSKVWTAIEVLDSFVKEKVFTKGTSWSYSNSNFLICGIIIEKITGLPFQEVVREKILTPYGYDGIQLHPMESLEGVLSHLWIESGGQLIDLNSTLGNLNAMFSAAWAAGAYVSRPTELASFAKALFRGEMLNASTMVEMLTPFQLNGDLGYGLGVFVYGSGNSKAYGHGGSIGYRSSMIYFPGFSVSVALSINDGTTSGDDFDDLVELLLYEYLSFISSVDNNVMNQSVKLIQNVDNDNLIIELSLGKASVLNLECIDLSGRKIKSIRSNWYDQGIHLINLDISEMSNGIYWINCDINGKKENIKFIIGN